MRCSPLILHLIMLATSPAVNADTAYFSDKLKDGSSGPEMAWIPAGKFSMGDIQGIGLKDEIPVHEVTISKRFAIAKHPVTFEQYDRFTSATKRGQANDHGWGRGSRPVIHVSWFDAMAYVKWLSTETGKKYRLPTEAEWEYAARGGTSTAYWWGNTMPEGMAHCYECGSDFKPEKTIEVATFKPNPFGLYDVAGNVWEWTASKWTQNYGGEELRQIDMAEVKVAANPLDAAQIAMRGGSWNLLPRFNRSSSRYYGSPQSSNMNLGFRIARDE